MNKNKSGKLIILSGPSCSGKSPLEKAFGKFYPELRSSMQFLVLYNSRPARPGETDGVDYHFRSRDQINAKSNNSRYVVYGVRGDLHALDMEALHAMLAQGDVFFEGSPVGGRELQNNPQLADIEKLSIYLSPLSREEIDYLKTQDTYIKLDDFITEVMRRKLLRRMHRQKELLSMKDLEEIERRATGACHELRQAYLFDHVIPCHDGEESENWSAFYFPIGDARKALLAFAALVRGETSPDVEHWDASVMP